MKKTCKFVLMLLCFAVLSGCGAAKLSDNYSEDTLRSSAEEVIKNLESGKYEEIEGIMDENLKTKVSAEKLEEVWSGYKKLGKYDSISKIIFQEKDGYAVVVAVGKFEEGKVQFTLSYNTDMKLVGFFLK
ncbi:MAG: hypothetical protein K0R09_600 [Clostridiales bacterium]|nr:hypothetical protein [Clostridiales bacterium]